MALHLANPAVAAQGFTTAVGSPSNGRRSLEPVFTVRLSHSVAITTASFRASSNTRAFIVIGSADPSHDLPICTVLNPTTATLPGLGGRSGSSDGKPSRPSVVTSAAASSASYVTQLGGGGGDGAGGSSGGGGSGGGGGGGGDGVGGEGNAGDAESDYGPILGWPKAEEVLSKAGVTLPEDMLAHVKEHGIAELLLQRYIDLQVGGGILAAATRSWLHGSVIQHALSNHQRLGAGGGVVSIRPQHAPGSAHIHCAHPLQQQHLRQQPIRRSGPLERGSVTTPDTVT
ncbi:hypothetical protein CLOP_g20779 [Closterium sp. NIES-67]|nr:hypothetical protein CLOP_g20779 [Closterium sp. NIES-67]